MVWPRYPSSTLGRAVVGEAEKAELLNGLPCRPNEGLKTKQGKLIYATCHVVNPMMVEAITITQAKRFRTSKADSEPLSKLKFAFKDYSVYTPIRLLQRLKQLKVPSSELVSTLELQRPSSVTPVDRAETLPDRSSSNDASELRDLDRHHEATSHPAPATSIHDSDKGTKQDQDWHSHRHVTQAQEATSTRLVRAEVLLPEVEQSRSETPIADIHIQQQATSTPVVNNKEIKLEIPRANNASPALQLVTADNEISSSDVEENPLSASLEAPAGSHAYVCPLQGTTATSKMREHWQQPVDIKAENSSRLKKLGPGVSLLGKGCHEKMTGDYFIAPGQEIPMSLVRHWANIIVPLLKNDIIAILIGIAKEKGHAVYQSRFHIGLYMVGLKQDDCVRATPGIVIFYTERNRLGKLAKALAESKKDYLEDFTGPVQVIHEDLTEAPRFAASAEADVSSAHGLQNVSIEQYTTDCGLKLKFDGKYQVSRYATLGGIICIEGVMYVMTTAHTLFSETEGGRGQHDADSSHPLPSSGKGFKPLRPERRASSSLVAYSFNGQVSKKDGTLSFAHTESDWALLAIADSLLLPNMNASYEIKSTVPDSTGMTFNVSILCGVDTCYTGYLTQSPVILDLGARGVITREILLDRPLPTGASGSWVVDCSEVHGYVVAVDGRGYSCFMIPMDRAFRDIMATFGENILFGTALNTRIRQRRHLSQDPPPMGPETSNPDKSCLLPKKTPKVKKRTIVLSRKLRSEDITDFKSSKEGKQT